MHSMGDSNILKVLDCNVGYCKIPTYDDDLEKTTFTTHIATYRYNQMSFRLCNSPETFQRPLYIILSGYY